MIVQMIFHEMKLSLFLLLENPTNLSLNSVTYNGVQMVYNADYKVSEMSRARSHESVARDGHK